MHRDSLYGFISAVVSVICFEYVQVALLLGYVYPGYSDLLSGYIDTIGLWSYQQLILWSAALGFVSYLFVAAYFTTAFSSLAKRTSQRTFSAVGLLLPIAIAVTTISIVAGLILIFLLQIDLPDYVRIGVLPLAGPAVVLLAWIVAAAAFFNLKTTQV
jgi:hypothetical protein